MKPEQINTESPHQPVEPAVVQGSPGAGEAPGLARRLGLFDITMLVMGTVIGAGIFAVPHDVASLVQSPLLILGAWVLGGVVSLAGSLVYAELTRRRPQVGGQYAFLHEAYPPAIAFVYGWSLLWIVQSGGMAWVAGVFADYFIELLRVLGEWLRRNGNLDGLARSLSALAEASVANAVVTTVAIGALTVVNCTGVRTGSTAQNIFMMLKILAIITLVVCGLLFADAQWSVINGVGATGGHAAATDGSPSNLGRWQVITAFGAALVPVFFAYGGSHTSTFVAGEVRDPRRNLPRGLVLGVSGVIALYLAVNFVCLRVLGPQKLAATKYPASEVMRLALGDPGAAIISIGIAISALGFLSQATLTSPRVYYAMATDQLFFKSVGWLHPRTRVPVVAILLQGGFAMVIAVSGTSRQILNYVMSVEMVFLSLTALSLFVIRRRDHEKVDSASSSVPGHPATTLLFVVVMLALVVDLFYESPGNSAIAIGIALTGVPVYFFWRRPGLS